MNYFNLYDHQYFIKEAEFLMDLQAKYKEQRTFRHGLLKNTHQMVLEVAAFILNLAPEILEEGIIDKDEYVDTFSNFFKEGGKRAIIIHYQEMTPPSIGIMFS